MFEPIVLMLVAFVVLTTGIAKSAFPGALGVLAVPLLLLVMPAPQALALFLPILIVADAFAIKSHWNQWHPDTLKTLIPGAVTGVIAGGFLVGYLPEALLSRTIGALAIIFSLRFLFFSNQSFEGVKSQFWGWSLSGISALGSTIAHAGGPPLMIYLVNLKLAPGVMVATTTLYFAVLNLAKLIPFVLLEMFDWSLVLTALAFSPLAYAGNKLGIKIRQGIAPKRFNTIVSTILLVLGGQLLFFS